ncbi:MAG: hypothetical protein ACTSRU_10820 [Candidatus Hodarchaeales archaeon]
MNLISEATKLNTGISPASINGASTGAYFGLSQHRKALFFATLGAMAVGATAEIQVLQALDAAGTDSKVITGAVATVTANTNASVIRLAIVTAGGGVHVAGQTVTITVAGEDYVFIAAAADDPLTREYAVGSTGADSAAALLEKINSSDENIFVPGVIGAGGIDGSDSIITLTSEEPGETLISAVASDSTTVVSTIEAISFVEIDSSALDVNNDFSHVAVRVTNSAAILTGVSLIRGGSRYAPDQDVADSAVVLS